MRLDQLLPRRPSVIASIENGMITGREARRLKELGFDAGVGIEVLHHGALSGPIACRVGRMTVALRRNQAAAVIVEPA